MPRIAGPNRVSIVAPVYNVAPYLEQCIASLRAQSHEDWEAIFVDDGSTDGSLAILQRHAAEDPRIRVIAQANAGASAARNRALDEIAGDCVYFLDPDDWMEPHLLRDNLRLLRDDDADVVLFQHRYAHPDGRDERVTAESGAVQRHADALEVRAHLVELMRAHNFYTLWNKLYSTRLLRRAGARFPALRTGEDSFFNFSLVPHIERLVFNDAAYYHYRINREGGLTCRNLEQFADEAVHLRQMKRAFDACGIRDVELNHHLIRAAHRATKLAADYSLAHGGLRKFRELCGKYRYARLLDEMDDVPVTQSKWRGRMLAIKHPLLVYTARRMRGKHRD